MTWRSYVYWRKRPFSGEHINVDENGVRTTFNPAPDSSSNLRIFTFGGSTMWGAGARDDGTIASFIARSLDERGYGQFQVTNYGEDGYVFTQEMIALLLEIRRANVPDIVIFYDGVNDSDSVAQTGRSGLPLNEVNRVAEFNYIPTTPDYLREKSKFIMGAMNLAERRDPGPPPQLEFPPAPRPSSTPVLAEEQLRVYWANVRTIRAMAREFGFEAYFFWQPRLLTKKALSEEEQRIIDAAGGPIASGLQEMFNDRNDTVYSDLVHIGEEGNQIVAAEMVNRIETRSGKLKRK